MAVSMCDCEETLRSLKPEQKIAVDALLAGEDVFAVLPTGFGKRSLCQAGTPMLALTGTAGLKMTKKIKKVLAMKQETKVVFVSPDRANIRLCVRQSKPKQEFDSLDWLVHLTKAQGIATPKTIVFCNTYNEIAALYSHLMVQLGEAAYLPNLPQCPANRLVGIFYSMTLKKYKERVVDSFKHDIGNARIVLASSALGMGVNFPDIRYVIHLRPGRTVIDHVQQAGRAGRDGKAAHNFVVSTGRKLDHCEVAIKDFAKSTSCLRVALLKTLDKNVKSIEPMHSCCSNCAKLCKCKGEECDSDQLPFEEHKESNLENHVRTVSDEDRKSLGEALKEYQASLGQGSASLLGSASLHGFSDQLIDDVLCKAESIFTIDDIYANLPVYSSQHAQFILCTFNELFNDIPEYDAYEFHGELDEINSNLDLEELDLCEYFDSSDSDSEDPDVFNLQE